jgi:hypothetical protein
MCTSTDFYSLGWLTLERLTELSVLLEHDFTDGAPAEIADDCRRGQQIL